MRLFDFLGPLEAAVSLRERDLDKRVAYLFFHLNEAMT